MPRQRSLFRFQPPFRFIADQLLGVPEFRTNLKKVASLPEAEFSSVATSLNEHPNFIVAADVVEILQKNIRSTEAETLARTLLQLNSSIRNTEEPKEKALEELCGALGKYPNEFSSGDVSVLRTRLQTLILQPLGFKRQKKAETLAEATGADLNDLNIICDVRPVFDDDRKEIDGALIIPILAIEILELDGALSSVECRLTEKQLDDLCKVALLAKQKIAVIKTLLSTKLIALARVFEPAGKEE
jgi:hypothetical protein